MATARVRQRYARPFAELVFSPWLLLPLAVLLGAFLAYQFFHLTPALREAPLRGLGVRRPGAAPVPRGARRVPGSLDGPHFDLPRRHQRHLHRGDGGPLDHPAAPRRPAAPGSERRWTGPFRSISAAIFSRSSTWRASSPWPGPAIRWCSCWPGASSTSSLVDGLRTESHLRLALNAFCVTAAFVDVTAIADYYFGYRLIPEWFLFAPATLGRWKRRPRRGGLRLPRAARRLQRHELLPADRAGDAGAKPRGQVCSSTAWPR